MEMDIFGMCRVCLNESRAYCNVFELLPSDNYLYEVLNDVCQLEVKSDDGLPQFLCCECHLKLALFDSFKRLSHEGSAVLQILRSEMQIDEGKAEPYSCESQYAQEEPIEVDAQQSMEEVEVKVEPDYFESRYRREESIDVDTKRCLEEVIVKNEPGDSLLCERNGCDDLHGLDMQHCVNNDEGTAIGEEFHPIPNELYLPFKTEVEEENVSVAGSRDPLKTYISQGDVESDEAAPMYRKPPEVYIIPGEVECKKLAPIGEDPLKLPSALVVESRTSNISEGTTDKENHGGKVFRRNMRRIANGKKNICDQMLFSNGMVFEGDGIRIIDRKSESNDVSLSCFNRRRYFLDNGVEGKEYMTSREKYCASDGTRLKLKPMEDDVTTERGNVHLCEGEREGATSKFSEASIPTGLKPYICQVCDKRFYKNSGLKTHERMHLAEKQFECEVCGRKFSTDYTLRRHKKTHESSRNSFRRDDGIDINVSCSSEAIERISVQESDEINIKRDNPESIKIRKNVSPCDDSNVQLIEGKNGGFIDGVVCDHCGKEFHDKRDLLEHLVVHYGKSDFGCLSADVRCKDKICREELVDDSSSNNPGTVNSAEKQFSCKYCSIKFNLRYNHRIHELIHAGVKPYACKYCSNKFSRRSDLNRHELKHTGVKPFSCKFCSKKFFRSNHLSRHELVHTGVKSHVCKYCSKEFAQKSNLQRHEVIHSGVKAHTCQYCSKKFNLKSALKKHELIHTGVKQRYAC